MAQQEASPRKGTALRNQKEQARKQGRRGAASRQDTPSEGSRVCGSLFPWSAASSAAFPGIGGKGGNRNVLLIAAQRPDATHLEGVRSWNELGRSVRPGEKGIRIFAPTIGIKPESQGQDASKNSRKRKKQEPETQLLGFRGVSVFDISQTGGETLSESRQPVDVAEKLEKLTAFAQAHGMTIEYVEWLTEKKATSYRGTIRLLPNMAPAEGFPLLLREVASQLLYTVKRRTFVTGPRSSCGNTIYSSLFFLFPGSCGLIGSRSCI